MKTYTLIVILGLVLSSLLLSGCAVMSAEDCEVADWGEIGFQHGKSGVLANTGKLTPYIKACAKANITPDQEVYELGRAAGARVYCEPQNGFVLGRSGKFYNNICDPDLEEAFLNEYDLGRELFTYEDAVREVEDQITHLQNDRESIQDDIADKRAYIKDETTLDSERKELKEDIYRLKQDVDNIENELDRLAYRLVQKEIARDEFKRSRGYY